MREIDVINKINNNIKQNLNDQKNFNICATEKK